MLEIKFGESNFKGNFNKWHDPWQVLSQNEILTKEDNALFHVQISPSSRVMLGQFFQGSGLLS
jgi:hypothetical protein